LIKTNKTAVAAGGPIPAPEHPMPGKFSIVGDSGVPVMHAALMPNGKLVFLDKVENYTQLRLNNGDLAFSAEWDPDSKALTPLSYKVLPIYGCSDITSYDGG
jgi:hypothetical protein